MTKGEIIGQVLLRVSGGKPNTDMRIRWAEVASYLAPAVNFVQTKNYWIERNAEDGYKGVNQLLLQSFEKVPVTLSASRDRSYSDLPKKVLSLPRGRSIPYVGTMKGKIFIPVGLNGGSMQEFYCCFKKDVTSYEIEGQKVWYWNLPPNLKEVLIKQIVDASDIADDEEIRLPSGSEPQVIQMMYEFFTGQRLMPTDPINDGQDINIQG